MDVYKHITINPHLEKLEKVLTNMEEEDKEYYLHSIVPVTEYQWVLVFTKWLYEE